MSNTRTEVKHKASARFAGTIEGIEASALELIGFDGLENNPFMPTLIPTYKFDRTVVNMLTFTWHREIANRQETDPRRGIWFGGPKGCGKTTVVEQFFARLGVPVVTLTCNRRIPLSDYVSKMIPDGEGGWLQVPGPLKVAMQMGYPVVLNEPSAMAPEDLVAMHDIIDRGILVEDSGEMTVAARGFHVYAADNTMGYGDTTGAYAGVNTMNQATISRFFTMEMGYPPKELELSILKARFPDLPEDALGVHVDFCNAMRQPYLRGESSVTMGTRELISWVEVTAAFEGLSQRGLSPAWFGFQRVMGGIPQVERAAAEGFYQSTFGVNVQGQ